MPHCLISSDHIRNYPQEGVVFIGALFADHIETLRRGCLLQTIHAVKVAQAWPNAAPSRRKSISMSTFLSPSCSYLRVTQPR